MSDVINNEVYFTENKLEREDFLEDFWCDTVMESCKTKNQLIWAQEKSNYPNGSRRKKSFNWLYKK